MPHRRRISELLLSIDAVQLSLDPPFTWTSGLKSPIYCDNRMLYSHPDARDVVVAALVERVKNMHIEPDCIAGTATAAIGWAAMVADRVRLPLVYVRAETKGHGARKRVEGDLKEGSDVLLIEDLLSTGGSAVSSVEVLRAEGGVYVHDVLAIFSYELISSAEKAQEAGVKLHPLADLTTLLQVAEEQGRISSEDVSHIAQFARDPQQWAAAVV